MCLLQMFSYTLYDRQYVCDTNRNLIIITWKYVHPNKYKHTLTFTLAHMSVDTMKYDLVFATVLADGVSPFIAMHIHYVLPVERSEHCKLPTSSDTHTHTHTQLTLTHSSFNQMCIQAWLRVYIVLACVRACVRASMWIKMYYTCAICFIWMLGPRALQEFYFEIKCWCCHCRCFSCFFLSSFSSFQCSSKRFSFLNGLMTFSL